MPIISRIPHDHPDRAEILKLLEDRSRFVAALAVRLAELGHAKEVRVLVAGTVEACEAVRSFLAGWRTAALQAPDAPGRDGAGSDGSEAVRSSSNAAQPGAERPGSAPRP
jgi:hypothetical protein